MKTWIRFGVLMVLTIVACTGGEVTEEAAEFRIATAVAKALAEMPTPTTAANATYTPGPAANPTVTPIPAPSESNVPIIFPDASLESEVRLALGKFGGGAITAAEVAEITTLRLSAGVADISGIEHLVNLAHLNMPNAGLTDISFLANLTNLATLKMDDNQISDISPLASLTKLTKLSLSRNQIGDVSSLASLTNLTQLSLTTNQIGDISPLVNLTSLTRLSLSINQITDISPLANLTNLAALSLGVNQINDVSPLLEIGGLGKLGSVVGLNDNNLDAWKGGKDWEIIMALRRRGVDVRFDFQTPPDDVILSIQPAIRVKLGLNPGEQLTAAKCAPLTVLSAEGWGIADLAGIELCGNLTSLYLLANRVTDISPLADLSNLANLDLRGNLLDLSEGSETLAFINALKQEGATVQHDPLGIGGSMFPDQHLVDSAYVDAEVLISSLSSSVLGWSVRVG